MNGFEIVNEVAGKFAALDEFVSGVVFKRCGGQNSQAMILRTALFACIAWLLN